MASMKRALGMFAHYAKWIPRYSERVRNFAQTTTFPISEEGLKRFEDLKQDIAKSSTVAINDTEPLTVETDASDYAIAATLSQGGRPVAFYSRTLGHSERRHSAVEKEAYAIVEALRKWRHYLISRPFRLITDQKSVSFMFNNKHNNKIKNDKILRWRLELACYKYDIFYRPGAENIVADTFSRVTSAIDTDSKLLSLHEDLCHPGVTRMAHWIRSKNLPYSMQEIKSMTASCRICAEIKPRFGTSKSQLIKATVPFERLSIDFKGPLPSKTGNKYLLTIIDEYSRFPFAFVCRDMTAETCIKHMSNLFAIFGHPAFVHSDQGSNFMSKDFKNFLHSRGVATSRTTAYNPQGNGQVERLNGTLWKTIELALRSRNLSIDMWETVLQQALHSIRSLLCTSINCTPHERMFYHSRKSSNGLSIPSWLHSPGPVLMKKHDRTTKYQPLVEEVELLEANPNYSFVRFPDGREGTVSNKHLAPTGTSPLALPDQPEQNNSEVSSKDNNSEVSSSEDTNSELTTLSSNLDNAPPTIRRSSRIRRTPQYLSDYHQ